MKLQQETVFFNPTPEVRRKRLKKYTVPLEHQSEWESEKLWSAVTLAINNDDQVAATEQKTILEEAQRERAKERKMNNHEWIPKYFVQVNITSSYTLYTQQCEKKILNRLYSHISYTHKTVSTDMIYSPVKPRAASF